MLEKKTAHFWTQKTGKTSRKTAKLFINEGFVAGAERPPRVPGGLPPQVQHGHARSSRPG